MRRLRVGLRPHKNSAQEHYMYQPFFGPVAAQRNIAGFDQMEFAPIKGFHAYEYSAAQLLYKMMGIVQRQRLKQET